LMLTQIKELLAPIPNEPQVTLFDQKRYEIEEEIHELKEY